jgi:hypothetical protein
MTLTRKRLRELLDYEAEQDLFIGRVTTNRGVRVGSVAGLCSNGYRAIVIDGKRHSAKALAVFWKTKEWAALDYGHGETHSRYQF